MMNLRVKDRLEFIAHLQSDGPAGGFSAPVAAARGEYLATVRLGTPERVFQVIVDTGSDLTWVQCSPCGKCYPQNDSLFLPSTSTSYTKVSHLLPQNSAHLAPSLLWHWALHHLKLITSEDATITCFVNISTTVAMCKLFWPILVQLTFH